MSIRDLLFTPSIDRQIKGIDKNGSIIRSNPIDVFDVINPLVEVSASILLNVFRKERTLTEGDVIGVKRGLYEHYGVSSES